MPYPDPADDRRRQLPAARLAGEPRDAVEDRAAHAHARALARRRAHSSSRPRTTRRSLAIRDMEQAGIDIITDGEIRRESYSNRFATALEGIDIDNPGEVSRARAR